MNFRLIFEFEIKGNEAFAARLSDLKKVLAGELGMKKNKLNLYIERRKDTSE